MKRSNPKWIFVVSTVLLTASLVGVVALFTVVGVDNTTPVEDEKPELVEPVTKGTVVEKREAVPVAKDLPRRLPVAGLEGYFITVNPDGSSYMEEPGGKKTPLADAGGPPTAEDVVVKRASERIAKLPQKRTGIGQLIVLDKGVIDVPKDAIITYTGPDKVVTHEADGSSTVYHVSGKVEHRERSVRVNIGDTTAPKKSEEEKP